MLPRGWQPGSVASRGATSNVQLFVYAVLLATLGLTMAYSNTAAQLGGDVAQGGRRSFRGIVWAVVALVAFAAANPPSTTRG